ncbi:hypothetical protein Tco_0049905, partial [Tanacetum coccineum]
ERLSKQSNELPLSRVNTLRSGEDRIELKELMDICTKLSDRVLDLENTQGRYGHDIKVNTASTSITTVEPITTISEPVTTVGVSVSTAEPSTPLTTTTTAIEDEDLIIAQTLMKMRSEKSKEKGSKENSSETATRPTRGVVMKEPSETATRPTIQPQQQLHPKDKVQLQTELEEEERLARQRKEVANITEWDDVQAMIDADHKLAER